MKLTFSTTELNGKTVQVLVSKVSKKEANLSNNIKNENPLCVVFGDDTADFLGYGYTTEEAIKNAKKVK